MNTRPGVYVDTSIVSYLVAATSKNPGTAGRQYETHRWWDEESQRFRLVTSALVYEEAGRGSADYAAKRISLLDTLEEVDFPKAETKGIVESLLLGHSLPPQAANDATHIAIAAVNGIEYLLTWNCAHLANTYARPKIEETLWRLGYKPVLLCTPYELRCSFQESNDDP